MGGHKWGTLGGRRGLALLVGLTGCLGGGHSLAQADWVVVAVHDGDTLRVRGPDARLRTVRLAGIDAPELDQPAGAQARDALRAWVLGRAVRLDDRGVDRYGRWLAVVRGPSPEDERAVQDVNLALLQQGWAWHDARHAHQQPWLERWHYRAAELAARAAGRGLWGQGEALPPWEWRRATRRSPAPTPPGAAAQISESCRCWSWAIR